MIQHSKPTFSKQDLNMLKPILESAQVSSGKIVRDFEEEFADYIGCTGAVCTNSGTSALHLGLLALGIGKNEEVIIPSYVCASVLNAIDYVGARPVLADIDYDTFNISVNDVRQKLTGRTKAIIMPHMFGLPCDIDEFLKLDVPIVEDCAQSLGSRYKNKLTGSYGIVSVFSFYATKVITTGYGGMITSNSKRLLQNIRDMSESNKRQTYKVRYNYKMSDLQAALGIKQLENLEYFIKMRRQIATMYKAALSGCNYNIELPAQRDDREHMYYRYVIKTKKANIIKRYLKKNSIEVMPPVFKPLHEYLSLNKNNFPNTEMAYKESVSLPIYPALKKKEIAKVIRVLKEAVAR